ncbi:MAG: GAF domain-containing protein [Planctomycetes bacterium]|nr:GAF domain-containing protein [Planctomycetota bacterium]
MSISSEKTIASKLRFETVALNLTRPDVDADVDQPYRDLENRYHALIDVVIPIGAMLFYERDYNVLLERILVETQKLCRADGGTLYLLTEEQALKFAIVRNTSLNIAMGGTADKGPPFESLQLYHPETGAPNLAHIATHCAITGQTINIPDAYGYPHFDFSGAKRFDQKTGYRSTSFVTVPLRSQTDRTIGVLQMINATDDDGKIIAFDPNMQRLIEALATLAAAALEHYQNEAKLRDRIAQLKVEIDHAKRAEEVSQIADTDYFRDLKARAAAIRSDSQRRRQ